MLPKGRKLALESLEPRRLLAADISLVRYFDTWDGSTIKSTDPAGLAYHPGSRSLYIADSEINEMPEYFEGHNIFEVSLNGETLHRGIASNNSEPTGITYNEFDGFFYVTNDNTRSIYRYDSALNSPLAVVDTSQAVASAVDPEGITSDPATGRLYVVDGRSGGMQVLVYNSSLEFQYRFSIAGQMQDGEGIAFDSSSGHLFIVSDPDRGAFEYTLDGTFLRKYDLSHIEPGVVAPQGLVFAPTSDPADDPSKMALYIADGMVDNHPDGRIFETLLNRPEPGAQAIEVRVAASSDDAEEQPSGSVSTTSTDLELVRDRHDQIVGIRFAGVEIPAGATILNAYVQFQVDETTSGESALVVHAENVDDAATFTAASANISSRTRTSNSVAWFPPDWTTVGEAGISQRTANLASIIQEIVDRPGWAAGNALAMIISGTGRRVAEAFDGKTSAAPLLRVEFSTDAPIQNQTPQVTAGGNQTVVLPDSASLAGVVSDDGLPAGGTLTVGWSVVGGPGTVTFASATSAETTASFSAAGTYVLRLTANDGELSASDDVTVTVIENAAPQVSAGQDQTVTLPSAASLAGVVSDDGLPAGNTLTIGWSVVSGPGKVTFANPSSAETTASFSMAGSYVLRLTASDGQKSASDELTVTVVAETVQTQTIEVRVASSSDDGEERANGWVTTTSSDLELVYDKSDQVVGVRFVGLKIPAGATIVSAYVQFQADQRSSTATSLQIRAQNVDNAPTFRATSWNLSSRARTSASVAWSPAAWTSRGEAGPDQRTPDVARVIQEVVNRPGWAAGNALALIITGTGQRIAEAYDGSANAAPLLRVEYATSAPSGTSELTYSQVTASPLQNQRNRFDVDGNGQISPIDSLLVLNRLNRGSAEGDAGGSANPKYYWDVNGDGTVSPLDALQVLNVLNRGTGTLAAGHGEAVPPIGNRSSALASSDRGFASTDSFFSSLGNSLAGTAGGSENAARQVLPITLGGFSDDGKEEERTEDLLMLLAESAAREVGTDL